MMLFSIDEISLVKTVAENVLQRLVSEKIKYNSKGSKFFTEKWKKREIVSFKQLS